MPQRVPEDGQIASGEEAETAVFSMKYEFAAVGKFGSRCALQTGYEA
jgi:hypothetical protein